MSIEKRTLPPEIHQYFKDFTPITKGSDKETSEHLKSQKEEFLALLKKHQWQLGFHIEQETGNALMHYAATYGHPDAIHLLVLEGEEAFLELKNKNGQTPKILADFHHGADNKTSQAIVGEKCDLEKEKTAIHNWALDMGAMLYAGKEPLLYSWKTEKYDKDARPASPSASKLIDVEVTPIGEEPKARRRPTSPFPLEYSLGSLEGSPDRRGSTPKGPFTSRLERNSADPTTPGAAAPRSKSPHS